MKFTLLLLVVAFFVSSSSSIMFTSATKLTGAIIGDYGRAVPQKGYTSTGEAPVAEMVKSWNPSFIITTGDNNYPSGSISTIDQNIGNFYCDFIYPYNGNLTKCKKNKNSVSENRFFPCIGNTDGSAENNYAQPYLEYFKGALPPPSGSSAPKSAGGRYYDVVLGDQKQIHLFALNSNEWEPDGVDKNSNQAQWLRSALSKSTSKFKIVYFHYCPFSYDEQWASTRFMRWDFKGMNATVVLCGHVHAYSKIVIDDFMYITSALSGTPNFYDLNESLASSSSSSSFSKNYPGMEVFYNGNYGAQLLEVSDDESTMTMTFISIDGSYRDTVTFYSSSSSSSSSTPTPSPDGNNNNKNSQQQPQQQSHHMMSGILIGLVAGVACCFVILAVSYLYTKNRESSDRNHPLRNRTARIAQARGQQMIGFSNNQQQHSENEDGLLSNM